MGGKMNVEIIRYPSEEDWMLVKQCALVTVGKEAVNPPKRAWKADILKARHSPIRELKFVFRIKCPYWVAMHLCRHHVGCQPYVRSQRNDRQSKYDRNSARQDEPVVMLWSMNAEALITIAQKRLCKKAAKETREVVEEMCRQVEEVCPEFCGLFYPPCYFGMCNEIDPC